jgi:hypothetical protein
MKRIKLTRGMFALVDDIDFDWLNKWKWYAQGNNQGKFYAARDDRRNGKRKLRLMHKEILGRSGMNLTGDHKNRNPLDNRRQNLRPATKSQDRMNASLRSDNKSGFKGVSWSKAENRWSADITHLGKHYFLGYFLCPKKAAKVYDTAAQEKFGEFAHTNFTTN